MTCSSVSSAWVSPRASSDSRQWRFAQFGLAYRAQGRRALTQLAHEGEPCSGHKKRSVAVVYPPESLGHQSEAAGLQRRANYGDGEEKGQLRGALVDLLLAHLAWPSAKHAWKALEWGFQGEFVEFQGSLNGFTKSSTARLTLSCQRCFLHHLPRKPTGSSASIPLQG